MVYSRIVSVAGSVTAFCFFHILPGSAWGAGFDCDRATTPTEIAICMDRDLGMLDMALNLLWLNEPKSTQDSADQITWLRERDACLSDKACLVQSYKNRLAMSYFSLGQVDLVDLFDIGQNRSVPVLVSRASFGGYNGLTTIYHVTNTELVPVPWIIPLFDEAVQTCGGNFLDNTTVKMTQSGAVQGWVTFKFEMDNDELIADGELAVYRKWVGHGDQSERVIYRLIDGSLRPDRALVDNCADQQADYVTAFFD